MNVSLTPKLERLLHKKVRDGRYTSVSEIVREALRRFEANEDLVVFERQDLRSKIAEGAASRRRGEGVDGETVFQRLDAKLRAMQKRRAA
jgi:antitoxin ParD1/3/4